jgi:hypothetical protein
MWLSGPQSLSGCFFKKEKILCPLLEFETPNCPFGSLDARPTTFTKILTFQKSN